VRALLFRLFLLGLPFAMVAAIVAILDPFHCFPWSRAVAPDNETASLAYRMDPPLWKLAAFRRRPAPNVLLGDSRMALLHSTAIDSLTGERFANLGYGGGSLDEAIKTFWYADRLVRLRSATFGVNLDVYNQANAKDRVTGTIRTLENPALYLCDRLVLRTVWKEIGSRLSGRPATVGVPPMSPDAFWNFQLDVTARVAYESYRYPDSYRRRLEEVAIHCRERGIALRFVIFPEHADLQARAARFHLENARARMEADLARIADTVDLAEVVDTHDRSRFTDPYHFAPEQQAPIVRRLWGSARRRAQPAATIDRRGNAPVAFSRSVRAGRRRPTP